MYIPSNKELRWGIRNQILSLAITVFLCPLGASAQLPPAASIAPSQQDLNGDALVDQIIANPYWNDHRGKVTIYSSMHPDSTIELTGVSPGDYFGWSMCLIPDEYHSAGIILAVGIPGGDIAGAVALYELKQIQWGKDIRHITLPKKYIHPTIETDMWFGFDLAPCFDVDGYGVVDMRIASRFEVGENELTRTYIFDACLGTPIAVITPDTSSPNSVPRPKSDSTLNGVVDEEDLLRVITRLGTYPSNILTGDLNGDSRTDGDDLVQVLNDLGITFFENTNQEGVCENYYGCGVERVSLPLGQACLTWLHCSSIGATFGTNPEIEEDGLLDWFFPFNNHSPNHTPCGQIVEECLNSPCVEYAVEQLGATCFGDANHPDYDDLSGETLWGEIRCQPCNCNGNGDDFPELFSPFGISSILCRKVGPFQHEESVPRSIIYLGCYNCADSSEEICRILAHELLHAVQQCKLGWLTKPCKEALKLSNTFHANPKNAFCLEVDVNSQLSQIDCASLSGESDCHSVCTSLSNNHGDWLDFVDCENFCESCGGCCLGHLWQPSEGNCAEDPCLTIPPTTDVGVPG